MIPPVLYVPRSAEGPEGTQSLDYRTTRDGKVALLAYTALDRLVECCGESQPWVLVETRLLDDINAQEPYDVILLDVEIPVEHRRETAQP